MCQRWCLVALLAFALLGCGGGPAPLADLSTFSPADAALPAGVLCDDPRADAWALPITKQSAAAHFVVSLVASDSSPPIIGLVAWDFTISDGGGRPVDGLSLSAKPWMPDHGHGTSVVPTVTSKGGGEYSVAQLYFFMAGLWQTTLHLSEGAVTDDVIFTTCLKD